MTDDQEIAVAITGACAVVGFVGAIGIYLAIAMAWDEFKKHPVAAPISAGVLMRRALGARCPACGVGNILSGYFTMNESCPHCGVIFWRGDGEWVGPAVINFSVAVGAALMAWAATEFYSLPSTLETALPVLAAVGVGVAIVPVSRSFWTMFLYISGEVAGPESKSG